MDLKTDALRDARPIMARLERGLRRAGQLEEADKVLVALIKLEEAMREDHGQTEPDRSGTK